MANQQNPENTEGLNLDNVDAVVLLDMSGSMDEAYVTKDGKRNGKTKWQVGEESITALAADLAKHDDDGITVIPFNDTHHIEDGVTDEAKVEAIFRRYRPNNGTYLAPPLRAAIDRFLPVQQETRDEQYTVTEYVDVPNPKAGQKKSGGWLGGLFGGGGTEPATIKEARQVTKTRKVNTGKYQRVSPKKQVCIVVYTDGAAGDENAVVQVLVDATKRIKSRRDLGVLFVQVGNDSGAEAFLNRLNNNLGPSGGEFDIVAVEKLEDLEDFSTRELIEKAYTE